MTRFSEKYHLLSSRLTTILLMMVVVAACLQYYYVSGFDKLASLNLVLLVTVYAPFIFLIVWLYYGKMELTIDNSELRIDMWRFPKTTPLGSIINPRVIDVHMMRDFGGFGYRPGFLGKEQVEGYVYPKQPKGVLFSYVGGARDIVISSPRPEELLNALHK